MGVMIVLIYVAVAIAVLLGMYGLGLEPPSAQTLYVSGAIMLSALYIGERLTRAR